MLTYKCLSELTISAISIALNSVRWMDLANVIINFSNAREFDMIEEAHCRLKNFLFQNV
jgi:hypothetical protein